MTMREAIDVRVSRRVYLPEPIAPGQTQALQESIARINAAQQLHIQLISDGALPFQGFRRSYGLLSGVQSYLALVGDESDTHHKEKLGYFGQQLVLEATALGLGTCWVGGSYRKQDAVCTQLPGQTLVCVICVGHCAQTDRPREKMVRAIVHRKGKSAAQMLHASGEVPEWVTTGMRAVEKAPSANHLQPVLFQYDAGTDTLRAGVPGGGKAVDLGIAKLHFALGAQEAGKQGRWDWGQDALFMPPSPTAL